MNASIFLFCIQALKDPQNGESLCTKLNSPQANLNLTGVGTGGAFSLLLL